MFLIIFIFINQATPKIPCYKTKILFSDLNKISMESCKDPWPYIL